MQNGTEACILIIDDQATNVRLLERILSTEGYLNVKGTTDPREAAQLYRELRPDLILLDLHMPDMDGFAVLNQLGELIPSNVYLPILILTADITLEARNRALSSGAKDFLTKPFNTHEVLLRIKNMLDTRRLHLQLHEHNIVLEDKVRERTRELDEARFEILDALARAAEFRDDETGQHTRRVGDLSAEIARVMGHSPATMDLIWHAAPLHDVGKIGIPDSILLKPGPLTAEELAVMRTHTTIGSKILSGRSSPISQLAESIARTHHERWDGKGYPLGLRGERIPLIGRIVCLADTYDALVHARPYKSAWPKSDAIYEIKRESGHQFDPEVVKAFLQIPEVY